MLLVFSSQKVSIYSASRFCHSDVIYFADVLDIHRTLPLHACVFTQKIEEATTSSASLLATLLHGVS